MYAGERVVLNLGLSRYDIATEAGWQLGADPQKTQERVHSKDPLGYGDKVNAPESQRCAFAAWTVLVRRSGVASDRTCPVLRAVALRTGGATTRG